jgi:hypothetical protein
MEIVQSSSDHGRSGLNIAGGDYRTISRMQADSRGAVDAVGPDHDERPALLSPTETQSGLPHDSEVSI